MTISMVVSGGTSGGGGGNALDGRKTVAIAGDSVTGQNSAPSTRRLIRDIGYMPWALRTCQHRVLFNEQHNFGVGGNNTADLLARFDDVLAAGTDYLILTIGGNDVTQSIAVEDSCANILEMWDRAAAAGVFVIHGLIYPRGLETTYSDAQKRKANYINNFMRVNAVNYPNVELISVSEGFIDYSNINGRSRTVCVPDGIHPGVFGAGILGREVGKLINKLEPPRAIYAVDPGDLYHATENPKGNLLPNGCMTGTSGGITGSATGTVAANCNFTVVGSVAGGVEVSVVDTPAFYPGQSQRAQRIVANGAVSASGAQMLLQQIATVAPAGQWVVGTCFIWVDKLVNLLAMPCDIRLDTGSGLQYAAEAEFTGATSFAAHSVVNMPKEPGSEDQPFLVVCRTPKIFIPVGSVDVRLRMAFAQFSSEVIDLDVRVGGFKLEVVPADE